METTVLWALVVTSVGLFGAVVRARLRLVLAAPPTIAVDDVGARIVRLVVDVLGQRRTIVERPAAGLAHALVFWGFLAFGGYTLLEFARGLGLLDVSSARWFLGYRVVLTPFATGVLAGITYLLVRRAFVRPAALGDRVSGESVVIGLCIATLMTTFLLTWRLPAATVAGRINGWAHAVVVLAFLVVIPRTKHFHLVLAPVTVFLKSAELGAVPNLDFEREQVGLEMVKDLGSKTVLDALTCVECGRCQDHCPATRAGQALNPKQLILRTQQALLAGPGDVPLAQVLTEEALWQCTTCGACEHQCPVGIEHLPLVVGARRGLVSNGAAPDHLGVMYNHLERRQNIWGLSYDQRQRFVQTEGLELFEASRHQVLVWLGCAGAFDPAFQQSLRGLFALLRARSVAFGVLAKERCTGDAAKRTGNEYAFQELATANIAELEDSRARTIVTSCPHCVKTIGDDYRRFGYAVEIVHSSVYVERLTRDMRPTPGVRETVTFHDPCYLGRYRGESAAPRALLARSGATVVDPPRAGANTSCCGAGGGLLFATREEIQGARISDMRLGELEGTGARTVVTACPFCSIMLTAANASAGGETRVVDLMTYAGERLLVP
jgi:Fe-S oxidoreductase